MQRWDHDQSISGKVIRRRNHINRNAPLVESAVDLIEVGRIAKLRIIGLNLEREPRIVGKHHRYRRLDHRTMNRVPDTLDLAAHLLDLLIAPTWSGALAQQAMPALLCAIARRSPPA